MADLTRFDFHAKRFHFSESVQMMSAEEVGQYLLLLVAAWLGGKDASLPDNPALLARYARVDKVSERVLEMFPVVETESGPRRRNETLFDEWQIANARSEAAKAKAEQRWGGSSADEDTPRNTRNAGALLVHSKSNAQTKPVPIQTNPNQTDPSQSVPPNVGDDHEQKPANDSGDWHALSHRHKRHFGKPVTNPRQHKDKYAEACVSYGEEIVLECFDAWASEKSAWVKSSGFGNPLFLFWKELPDLAADAIAIKQADALEAAQRAQETAAAKKDQAIIEQNVQRQKDEHTRRWTAEAPPENAVSVLEYLAEVEEHN